MKVLMLNTYDEHGGAAKAAFRLNRGMHAIGIDSHLLVQAKTGNAAEVSGATNPVRKIFYGIRTFLGTVPVRMYPKKPVNNFTPAMMPDCLAREITRFAPDVAHLHWIGAGFMRVETLQKIRIPLVWTLHDSWAFTGGCHMPYDCTRYRENCGSCPILGSQRREDLSWRVLQRKNKAWCGLNLTVVTPSRWLANCARKSSLFRDRRIEVIPNGIDLSIFKPTPKQRARDLLELPRNKKLILFGGINSTSDPNKGFQFLLPALKNLSSRSRKQDIELLVFGSSVPGKPLEFNMRISYLGRLQDESSLALLYSAADLLVVPSRQENLPNTILESMACGTPCVAFNQGGIPEIIDHGLNGYLANPFDQEDLAHGIGSLLGDDRLRQSMAINARQKVKADFSLQTAVRRYGDLYGELLSGGILPLSASHE